MNKRFALVALLLAMVMLLSGCNLIGYDKELDGAQVVAKVETNQVPPRLPKRSGKPTATILPATISSIIQQYFGVSMQLTEDDVDGVRRCCT